MELGEECRSCLLKSQTNKVRDYIDKEKRDLFINRISELCKTFPNDKASPLLMREINNVHKEIFNESLNYHQEKIKYNQLCLDFEDKIRNTILNSDDPLKKAIQFARVGNLIDFAKLSSIDIDLFEYFINKAEEQDVDLKTLSKLKMDLENANVVVYLLDNCGEIVFDKLLIEQIKKLYPNIKEIHAIVRKEEIINDVTYFDARMVGLDKVCIIDDNGTDIPGTYLKEVSKHCLDLLNQSDVIISKGLGNFETLNGCKLNIYYMFLCKCDYFADKFNLKKWESVLVNEKDLKGKKED